MFYFHVIWHPEREVVEERRDNWERKRLDLMEMDSKLFKLEIGSKGAIPGF